MAVLLFDEQDAGEKSAWKSNVAVSLGSNFPWVWELGTATGDCGVSRCCLFAVLVAGSQSQSHPPPSPPHGLKRNITSVPLTLGAALGRWGRPAGLATLGVEVG